MILEGRVLLFVEIDENNYLVFVDEIRWLLFWIDFVVSDVEFIFGIGCM